MTERTITAELAKEYQKVLRDAGKVPVLRRILGYKPERTITSDDVRCPKCCAGSVEVFSDNDIRKRMLYMMEQPVRCDKCGTWFYGYTITLHKTVEVHND